MCVSFSGIHKRHVVSIRYLTVKVKYEDSSKHLLWIFRYFLYHFVPFFQFLLFNFSISFALFTILRASFAVWLMILWPKSVLLRC